MSRYAHALAIVTIAILIGGCADATATSSPTLVLSPTSTCRQSGTAESGKIDVPRDQPSFAYSIYLPPCYALYDETSYPVLYWTAIGGQNSFEVADQLIMQGDLSHFLLVMLNIDLTEGYGADERIITYAVPYIDAHYRTRQERAQRSIAGISHGAAIAARTAFRAPQVFGRVAVISGGINEIEQEQFAAWIAATPTEQWPAVLIDVGDQDGIIALTRYLMETLDEQGVPYRFTQGSGGHSGVYWASHKADYLKWLIASP